MKRLRNYLLAILITLLLTIGLQAWHPWQRQPVVFYEPVIFLPLEVVAGDRIVLSDKSAYIEIHNRETITSIEHEGKVITIRAIRHITLWDKITGNE